MDSYEVSGRFNQFANLAKHANSEKQPKNQFMEYLASKHREVFYFYCEYFPICNQYMNAIGYIWNEK